MVFELSDERSDVASLIPPIDIKKAEQIEKAVAGQTTATAYVDGSYEENLGVYGYGVVLFFKGVEFEVSGRRFDSEHASQRQVPGEILSAVTALKFCVRFGISHLDLYYDFENLEKWITGEYATNIPLAIEYKAYYGSISGKLSVDFHWVKSHSHDSRNDRVDGLAKAARTAPDDFTVKIIYK